MMYAKFQVILFHLFPLGPQANATWNIEVLDMVARPWTEEVTEHVPVLMCSSPHGPCDTGMVSQEFLHSHYHPTYGYLALLSWTTFQLLLGYQERD